MVALCKIWRKGNSAAASPQATNPSIFSPEASTSQLQVLEDHFLIHEGMQIDQPQGQLEGTAQQYHMSDHAASTIGNIVLPDSSGGCVRSTGPNDDSTTYQTLFQDAVSFLHKMTGPFKQICISRRDRARKIALEAQNVKSSLENELNSLGINAEPESTMACTSNSTQLLVEPASTAGANTAALAPATTAQDEFPDQQLWSRSMEESYIDVGTYLNLDGGNNGTNLFDPDEAM
uniref:Uncharacterized protein n=1 Tax=Arundo donax TaxID=35708 RepID=A0A0A8Y8X6_ARUDO